MPQLTDDELDDLWEEISKCRKNGKFVKVRKNALENLLMDYHKMYDIAIEKDGSWKR